MLRGALLFTLILAGADYLHARPPLRDSITLNVGVNCQWQKRCMAAQLSAMKHAIGYVKHHHPAQWRIQMCNRNARRPAARVDWVGFDHCIRNAELQPPKIGRPRRQHR